MNENRSKDIMNGSIYDGPEYSTTTRFLGSRVPSVGAKVEFDDGRKFVFVSTAVDVAVGQIVATPTCLATVVANLCTAAAIGATEVTVNTKGLTMFGGGAGVIAANALAGGYLSFTDDLGEGFQYRIKSHNAGTAAVSVTFKLFDPLKIAIDATSDLFLVAPRYENVVVGTATLPPVGVAVIPSTAATNVRTEYIWVQTAGVATTKITTGTNIAIGLSVAASSAGGVIIASAATTIPIGIAMATSTTDTAKIPVLLNIGG
jgi:hypothetical protein